MLDCSELEMGTHTMLESREGGLRVTLQPAVKSRRSSRYLPLSFARAALPASFLGFNCKDFS